MAPRAKKDTAPRRVRHVTGELQLNINGIGNRGDIITGELTPAMQDLIDQEHLVVLSRNEYEGDPIEVETDDETGRVIDPDQVAVEQVPAEAVS